eukprot:CAMPEP_0179124110 /NCGR_PEP_ID=MMETSP0796-20121207/58635_1 /TAXON_ID=73915 /ORGANISM="Pyrodinium bahamense, Strain pbaha01" /LENGTH=171 /DNA_ID=CAMNT_0020822759 /DNA_START=212 /DNA_END=724 /DNA_ORIENTATION=-
MVASPAPSLSTPPAMKVESAPSTASPSEFVHTAPVAQPVLAMRTNPSSTSASFVLASMAVDEVDGHVASATDLAEVGDEAELPPEELEHLEIPGVPLLLAGLHKAVAREVGELHLVALEACLPVALVSAAGHEGGVRTVDGQPAGICAGLFGGPGWCGNEEKPQQHVRQPY